MGKDPSLCLSRNPSFGPDCRGDSCFCLLGSRVPLRGVRWNSGSPDRAEGFVASGFAQRNHSDLHTVS